VISESLKNLIHDNQSFCIASHINPEYDAIGSTVALGLSLKKMGKTIYLFNKDGVPESVKFLPSSDLVTSVVPEQLFDVLFIVDCGSIERVGVKDLKARKVAIIDHHIPNGEEGDERWVDPKAGAAGELIYLFLKSLHVNIDKDIALNLYTSIFTDTGGCRYSNTTPQTMRILADLLEIGVDIQKLNEALYESVPLRQLKLIGHCLTHLKKDGPISWIVITQDIYEKTGSTAEDTENLVNYPRMLKDVTVAFLLREVDHNTFKVSLRSKGAINVAEVASNFGGGGHMNAAGCKVHDSPDNVEKRMIEAVRKVLNGPNSMS
jgi:phosphoesterase RecJ-like protein